MIRYYNRIISINRGELMHIFSIDGPIWRFFNLVYNLVLLHVLWVLYSLPIVTIGASTTALYYACMKMIRTNEGDVHKNFHRSFKQNLKQSTIIWLAMVVIVFLYITDLRYGLYLGNTMGRVMIISCSVFLIPLVLTTIYIFPVQAKFENKIRDNIKNALLMSLRHFPCSLLLCFILGTFILLTLSFVPFIMLMVCCGAGLIAYLTSNIFIYIFRKYLPDELEDDLERSGEHFS